MLLLLKMDHASYRIKRAALDTNNGNKIPVNTEYFVKYNVDDNIKLPTINNGTCNFNYVNQYLSEAFYEDWIDFKDYVKEILDKVWWNSQRSWTKIIRTWY